MLIRIDYITIINTRYIKNIEIDETGITILYDFTDGRDPFLYISNLSEYYIELKNKLYTEK